MKIFTLEQTIHSLIRESRNKTQYETKFTGAPERWFQYLILQFCLIWIAHKMEYMEKGNNPIFIFNTNALTTRL